MNRSWFFIFVFTFFSDIGLFSQSKFPPCLNELIIKTAEQHKRNSCEGSDKFLRIEQYSYKDTLLYKLVFEKKTFCPDYINSTFFYDANCQIKIQIRDGGLAYRRQVIPSYVNAKEIKFIKTIDEQKNNNQQNNGDNGTLLTVNANGNQLRTFYLGLNVENLWIAGSHINWETGVADKPDATSGNHTHCSAFVAATCKKLNVYILRPPDHKQQLLANAQFEWLTSQDAGNAGWKALAGNNRYEDAQALANKGMLVIAICTNPDDSKPGHTALVMPTEITKEKLIVEGPVVIMAGTHNHNTISLMKGFKSHLTGWPENTVKFYYNTNMLQLRSN